MQGGEVVTEVAINHVLHAFSSSCTAQHHYILNNLRPKIIFDYKVFLRACQPSLDPYRDSGDRDELIPTKIGVIYWQQGFPPRCCYILKEQFC